MKAFHTKRLAAILATGMLLFGCALPCSAVSLDTDTSYTYTASGDAVPDKEIYAAVRQISGEQTGSEAWSLPEDLFIYNGKYYIADTGNNRVVVLDSEFHFLFEISQLQNDPGAGRLSGPKGVFANECGILICDNGNQRVVLTDELGNVLYTYEKPDTAVLTDTVYKPSKALMDEYHNVYILASGVYQGFMQYDLQGNFQGFFGSNDIEASAELVLSRLWKKFFGNDASKTMSRDIPLEYNNAHIDENGFIYATIFQTDTGSNNLKQLNARGANILTHLQDGNALDRNRYGDQYEQTIKGTVWRTTLIDVTTDSNGVITVLDSTWGRLFQYSTDGDLLGVFGGLGTTLGHFSAPSAVDEDNGQYYVLDRLAGSITVFEPTAYRTLLGEALVYYQEGAYQESIDVWQEVLKYNSGITLAYKSIGKAYMQQQRYDIAREYLKNAGDRESYSMVLGQLRQQFFQKNIWWLLVVGIGVIVGLRFALRALFRWLKSEKTRLR